MSSIPANPVLDDLPLFPLHTVLFPGGLLPLKIFEARYLDMARACLREQSPFGVCLLKSGHEVASPGDPSVPEPIGCLAEIAECDVDTFGLLLVQARGTARFKLIDHRVEPSNLLVGTVQLLGDDQPLQGTETLAKFGACAEVLERIIDTIREREPQNLPFVEPFLFDDPTWVSNRLSEILPIPMRARQKLMELMDAGARIDVVHHYMQHHQLL
ncbi:LON peptidase substrate-binding domain-containing protein [Caballeronia sp. LZ034LL]|uniref:LON peptidase substrate-binding domain-containing protein n=1 Tax=Caballeronia sp. LZ034LL TaxID=3038567 RepID=UPI0028559E9D|nr:LON peptidase substrate-binding domain-containing protein [Caballeronia sp. LZ034LL]MDR5832795.1 LON peptidase substrate-binding domain-containing protein [Caballeronia sp. LZ034LL]